MLNCGTNFQAAQVVGIILFIVALTHSIVSSILNPYGDCNQNRSLDCNIESWTIRFIDTFFNLILVFGVIKKNGNAITVWMVLAIIKVIYIILYGISLVINFNAIIWPFLAFHIAQIPLNFGH